MKLFDRIAFSVNWRMQRLKKLQKVYSTEFKEYYRYKGARFVLLDTPEHDNIGDAAIALAEKQFIHDFFPQGKLFEFTYDACHSPMLKMIKKSARNSDCFFCTGGAL